MFHVQHRWSYVLCQNLVYIKALQMEVYGARHCTGTCKSTVFKLKPQRLNPCSLNYCDRIKYVSLLKPILS